jgi:hypothetical protein
MLWRGVVDAVGGNLGLCFRQAAQRVTVGLCAIAATIAVGAICTTATAVAATSGLADHRAYELVSAADNLADVYVPASGPTGSADINTSYPFRSSANGEAMTYVGFPGKTGGNGLTGSGFGNQFLALRNPALGWEVSDITPQVAGGGHEEGSSSYELFSSDLSVGVLGTESSSTFAASATPEGPAECSVLYARTATGFHALFSEAPAPSSCGSVSTIGEAREQNLLVAGASADGSQFIFQSPGTLAPGAEMVKASEGNNLYDSAGGRPSLVNVLPGEPAPAAVYGGPPHNGGGGLPGDFSNVISEDGSKVFWTDLSTQRIYMRENPASSQSPLVAGDCTAPEDACTVAVSAGPAQYWAATPDGEYVYYTENGELWRFDTSQGTREALVSKGLKGENAEVLGVIGVGGEGPYIYFVADGALSAEPNDRGEVATPGTEANLYVLHVGQAPRYIAALGNGAGGDWRPDLGQRTAEVAPGGLQLVFESTRQLTGAGDAPPGEESFANVFVYAAEASGPGSLFCASCNPSGAAPNGELTGAGGYLPVSMHPTFQPRWISDDGDRVFFDSFQALAPQDRNGVQDVYEWEREGEGTCTVETPSRPDGGCVFLLSGGDSSDYSYFLDADSTGANVFFAHRGLLGQIGAADERNEVVDARVDGGFPQVSLACTGTGCQGVPSAPPIFATPASVTFSGPGNLSSPPPAKPKTAAQLEAEKLAKALKSCRTKNNRRRRTACEARARTRYGAARKAGRSRKGRSRKGRSRKTSRKTAKPGARR